MIVSTEVEWELTTRGLSIGAVTFDFEVEMQLKARQVYRYRAEKWSLGGKAKRIKTLWKAVYGQVTV